MSVRPAPEKTIFDVLRDVWRARYDMAAAAVIALILAAGFTFFCIPHYKAEMMIAPAASLGQDVVAQTRSLEGTISIQHKEPDETSSFLRFEHIFSGGTVARVLLQDQSIKDVMTQGHPFLLPAKDTPQDAEALSRYLKKNVKIEPVSGTILRRLSYMHPNPQMAKAFLARVHKAADDVIRQSVAQETDERISYLQQAIEHSVQPEQKRILTDMLIAQERMKMMVSMNQPYAAAVVEPPYVSPRPVWPDPYLVYPLFILAGLFAGFISYGLRHHGKNSG